LRLNNHQQEKIINTQPQAASYMRRLRWSAFVLVALAYMLSFFHRMAPAVIASDLQQAFQVDATRLGVLAATYFYVYTIMQIPTGILVDTVGPRRIVALGGLIAGLGSILFGMAETFTVAATGRTLVGLGVSVTFIALLKLNAAWFRDREFATLAGLTVFIGNLGAVSSATPLAWALAFTTWRHVFVTIGVLSVLLGLLTWLLVRNNPAEAGLPSMREQDGEQAHAPHSGHWYDGLVQVMKNPATWPGFWVNLGVGGTFLTFAGLWAVPYLSQVHAMDRTTATWHTSAMLLAFAVSSLVIGALSDRLGQRRPLLMGLAALYTLCWLPWLMGFSMPLAMSLSLFAVMGFSAAGFTLTWTCAKEVNPPALSGMATSLVNTGVFLGPAIYQPLVGWLLDRGWEGRTTDVVRSYNLDDYRLGIALLLGLTFMGLISTLFIRETYGRQVTV
jgi:sugar phosphate permease